MFPLHDWKKNKHAWRVACACMAVVVLLGWPACSGFQTLKEPGLSWLSWLATVGLVGLLVSVYLSPLRVRAAWLVALVALLSASLFVRMLFFGLTRFSGHDFGPDFFLHLGAEAAQVAWEQFRQYFVWLALGMLGLVVALFAGLRRAPRMSARFALGLGIASLLLLALSRAGMPEWRLAQATRQWYSPPLVAIADSRLALWRQSALIEVDPVTVQRLMATAADPPQNLILLYIEAGGVAMAPADRYPGLMPNLKRLIERHGLVEHLHASSYVTMEGIVNSQCGTLFPIGRNSEAMAGFDNLLERMPCLGDVLRAAGYRQTFLGGADKRFAGKGRFLAQHGYDKVMGQHDWAKQKVFQRRGTWGVSDVDLFRQSLLELQRLKDSGQPFNLTLLTIGTHLPGFAYEECAPYGDGKEVFLNAAHCTDTLVGQWIEDLQRGGWLDDNTWLVITGDHHVFPSVEMKRLFGDEAVADRRLPLIVLGGRPAPEATQSHGAGYDLAPTVLDLLGVTSNAHFALGRSLFDERQPRDFYVSRFGDILGEDAFVPDQAGCPEHAASRIPGAQALTGCEREELFTILDAQARNYSAPPSRVNCNSAVPLRVALPEEPDGALRLEVSGVDESDRYIWRARHVDPDRRGLYVLALNENGRVLSRRFYPPDELPAELPDPDDVDEPDMWLVAWLPDAKAETHALPDWMDALGVEDPGAWLLSSSTNGTPRRVPGQTTKTSLLLDHDTCLGELRQR